MTAPHWTLTNRAWWLADEPNIRAIVGMIGNRWQWVAYEPGSGSERVRRGRAATAEVAKAETCAAAGMRGGANG